MEAFKKRYILPVEHGAWAWLIAPFCIAWIVTRPPATDALLLAVATLSVFCLRQPLSLFVRGLFRKGRQPDIPALVWTLVYTSAGLLPFLLLLVRGFGYLWWFAAPVPLLLGGYVWMTFRRYERQERLIECIGAATLCLTAPAVVLLAGSTNAPAVLLWGLCAIQAVGSVLQIHTRLTFRQAERKQQPRPWGVAIQALAWHAIAVAVASYLSFAAQIPFLPVPYLLVLGESLYRLRGPHDVKIVRIGIQQLILSVSFSVLLTVVLLIAVTMHD